MKNKTNVQDLAKQIMFDMGSMFKHFVSVNALIQGVKQENQLICWGQGVSVGMSSGDKSIGGSLSSSDIPLFQSAAPNPLALQSHSLCHNLGFQPALSVHLWVCEVKVPGGWMLGVTNIYGGQSAGISHATDVVVGKVIWMQVGDLPCSKDSIVSDTPATIPQPYNHWPSGIQPLLHSCLLPNSQSDSHVNFHSKALIFKGSTMWNNLPAKIRNWVQIRTKKST